MPIKDLVARKAYADKYRQSHREQRRIEANEYYRTHKVEKATYSKKHYAKNKDRISVYQKEYRKKNPERLRANERDYRTRFKEKHGMCINTYDAHRFREEIIRLLGGKCSNSKCQVLRGLVNPLCLQIDHVGGGGNKERKQYHTAESYYRHVLTEIKNGSKAYKLLCANCNWIKRYENNEVRSVIINA